MAQRGCMAIKRTITLDTAIRAVKAYNSGWYRGEPNLELDRRAQQTFSGGLACTLDGVYEQVRFIGDDYGGVAGFPAALSLAPMIAQDIYINLDAYGNRAKAAPALIQTPSTKDTIEFLLDPFDKPLHGKRIWLTWASKFWHFLNPNAFPIGDSRVCRFFGIQSWSNSSHKYAEGIMENFRKFAVEHEAWLEPLFEEDGGHSWSEIKLWDKVFYGLVELEDDFLVPTE